MQNKDLPKVAAIIGPTASGKTGLGIALAKKFNGEVISLDSRQLYQKMKIGTAQPEGEWKKIGGQKQYLVEGIAHYLIDVFDPGKNITLSQVKKIALQSIFDIALRGKFPILVGGTGLYLWSIIDNLDIPKIAPNKKLRGSLEKKSLADLQQFLRSIDPKSAAVIDMDNPRRLIRALEVCILSGESFTSQQKKREPLVDALQIGISMPLPELYERIEKRIKEQFKNGFVKEVMLLVRQKYGWNLPSMSSIGYRQIGSFLKGECTEEEAIEATVRESKHYAKKQMTWFKRDKRINWINGPNEKEASRLVEEFLIK